jgi:hypothetical protein
MAFFGPFEDEFVVAEVAQQARAGAAAEASTRCYARAERLACRAAVALNDGTANASSAAIRRRNVARAGTVGNRVVPPA